MFLLLACSSLPASIHPCPFPCHRQCLWLRTWTREETNKPRDIPCQEVGRSLPSSIRWHLLPCHSCGWSHHRWQLSSRDIQSMCQFQFQFQSWSCQGMTLPLAYSSLPANIHPCPFPCHRQCQLLRTWTREETNKQRDIPCQWVGRNLPSSIRWHLLPCHSSGWSHHRWQRSSL